MVARIRVETESFESLAICCWVNAKQLGLGDLKSKPLNWLDGG